MQYEECFVSLSKRTVIDVIGEQGLGQFSKQNLDEVRARYPDAMQMGLAEAADAIEAMWCSDAPTEISTESFFAAMEELPPVEWINQGGTETFKSQEASSGQVTAIYARIGERCFSFLGRYGMSHNEIIAFCQQKH